MALRSTLPFDVEGSGGLAVSYSKICLFHSAGAFFRGTHVAGRPSMLTEYSRHILFNLRSSMLMSVVGGEVGKRGISLAVTEDGGSCGVTVGAAVVDVWGLVVNVTL